MNKIMGFFNRKETVMPTVQESVIILIPTYQPADALVSLCQSLSGFTIVCVDDGSGGAYDGVFERAADYAHVLRYETNRGKGGALKYGIRYIAENPAFASFQYIVTADADGQHKPADIIRVAEAVCEKGGFILGVRRFTGKVPARSMFGNSLTKLVFRIASGKGVSDTQTGLRAFEVSRADLYANVPGERYEYEMNVLFAVADTAEAVTVDEKVPITEVEIETVYEGGNEGSHFRPIRDSYRIYKTIFLASRSLKYLFSSGLAFVIDYVLLLLLDGVLPVAASMEIAAPAAWIVSSLTNFFLNRNFVFRSNAPLAVALPEYYGLAGIVFVLKTYVLLELLTRLLHIPLWIAKLAAEVVFFISNYFIQKKFIFKKKDNRN